jgi:hypothetical protein
VSDNRARTAQVLHLPASLPNWVRPIFPSIAGSILAMLRLYSLGLWRRCLSGHASLDSRQREPHGRAGRRTALKTRMADRPPMRQRAFITRCCTNCATTSEGPCLPHQGKPPHRVGLLYSSRHQRHATARQLPPWLDHHQRLWPPLPKRIQQLFRRQRLRLRRSVRSLCARRV